MNLLKKIIYPVNLKRVILSLILVIAITTITMGAVFDVALKNVTLVNIDEFNGIKTSEDFSTRKTTFKEFLNENKIIVAENDVVNRKVDEEISNNDVLIIRKGRVIELAADGNVEFLTVTKPTVGEALEEAGVKISEEDIIKPSITDPVTDRMTVNIDRLNYEYITEKVAVEFDTERVEDNTLESGKTKVIESGKNGEKEVKYSLMKKNGEVISKDIVSQTVIKEPVTRIVHVGTKKITKAAPKKNNKSKKQESKSSSSKKSVEAEKKTKTSDKGFSYKKKIEVKATAYDKSLQENGGHSKTAYGLVPQRGVVAVDPKVIPLGTKLYIESADGGKSWVYGYCIAGDTGGAIKGNRVDLCFDTNQECIKFGRRNAIVYILN